MPTEKPRVTITVSEEELKQINDYRFSHKMKNQTQAIISLVEKGIESLQQKGELEDVIEPKPLGARERKLLDAYNALNDEGREMLELNAENMTYNPKYKKRDKFQKSG